MVLGTSATRVWHRQRHARSVPRTIALAPLAAALLLAFPVMAGADAELPDLGANKPAGAQTSIQPGANGLTVNSRDADSRFTAATESSQHGGTAVGFRGALALTAGAALGGGWLTGGGKNEIFANLGLRLGDSQRLILTGAQLRQKLDFDFPSGAARADMTQNAAGASWRFALGGGLFDYAEANAYTARTASRDLGGVAYAADTAALYELWNDPRRIAGGSVDGLQGRLGLRPWDGGRIAVGFGQERLRYDLLGGAESHNRATGSLGLEQAIDSQTRIRLGADAAAAQSRTSIGLDYRIGGAGTLGIDLVKLRSRDGAPGDNRVQLSWTLPLGKAAPMAAALPDLRAAPRTGLAAGANAASTFSDDALLDQVAQRPGWLPSQVVAKRDTTTAPVRLVAVDKTALPAGASVHTASGAITTPLGIAVTAIAGVTRNGTAFANAGQFALSGNSLVINPGLIAQPAVGVVDTYVVTANNAGGGTTLVTVKVSHGSVKIDSISIAVAAAAAPAASSVAISGTAQVGQTLTGSYTYADVNGDAQGTSTFRWLRNGAAIAGATATTYTLVAADQGKTVAFEVTPVATVAPTTGTPVVSSATAAVAGVGVAAAPTASAVSITGTAQVGQLLTGTYTYADANNDAQGVSTFRWLRNGVAIAGATASTYTLVAADQGGTISFEVTPVATAAPTTGTPVVSGATAAVVGAGPAVAPTAGNVAIAGTAQVGQALTGSYAYADANGDAQGASTFRWLRGGVAIAGATATTYTLVAADQGNAIAFEVTPVATVAPTTGSPVVSSATAAVAGVGVPAAPTASNVAIGGTAQVGQVLTGSYTYADVNNDAQGTSTFRWLRNGTAIAGATATSYTLVAADQGKTVAFEVTPVATAAPTTGTPVVSSAVALAPGAPAVTANDDANTISLNGSDGAALEVLTTGATAGYAAFNAAATYAGNQTVWVRVKAAGAVPAGAATVLSFTEVAVDAATTVAAPTLSGKTTTTIAMTPGTFSDADGVRNVIVERYNSGCVGGIISTAASGNFSGLTAGTTYGFKTKGEAMNGVTGLWEAKSSSCVDITTDAIPAVSAASMVDGGSVAPGETKNLVITVNNLAANYADAAAVRAALSHFSTGASTGFTVTWGGMPAVDLAAGIITYGYLGNDVGSTVESFSLGAVNLGTHTILSTGSGI